MLLHGFLCRPGGMPGQGLEDLAMLLPGFLRTLRADERQLLTFQEDLGAGGDQGEHRLVAAGGENTLVKLEIQPVGLLEIACTQLAAHLLDVVFENVQHLGGHHPDRQTTGKTLQGEAQLKGIGRRHLRGEGPGESAGHLRPGRFLNEHTLAGLHADQAQRFRVAIARALAMSPKVLLCDEITSALDPELVNEVLAVVKQLASEGMTLIMVTHEMRFAREVGDKLAFMHHGKVHEIGDPKALFAAPQTEELSNFIGSVNL